ncbi:MAG: hypothetical protein CVU39_25715 [Chloroflexi bacterium HGW-Chloroflexi-10]|nr:MAG: hypothetical protein CVU39_25715 [Chloroflexi bacterium HGW-Chloroflexi-10]
MNTSEETIVSGKKLTIVVVILGFILVLAGSIYGVDWMNYFFNTGSVYPVYAKPVITLLSFFLVLIAGRHKFEQRDWILVLLAFCCMLPTDILMSLVVVSPALSVGSWVFMVGGVLSIIAHIFLIIRVGRGLGYLRKFRLSEIWLPLIIYGSAVVILLVLWQDLVRVGHAVIGPVYTAFFCTTVWLSWETVRRKLLPRPNAWMAAIAATCWYVTEILGEIYNLGMGNISNITFGLVWVFYGANVVLWALSVYRWKVVKEIPRHRRKSSA